MWYQCNTVVKISIHALLAESDGILGRRLWHRQQFLSTLSLRRATTANRTDPSAILDFYPRSPCGERQQKCGNRKPDINFYPRSPCGERPPRLSRVVPTPIFLSTLSLRRATHTPHSAGPWQGISIHALLAESDTPRLSRVVPTPIFLSTLSLRRATTPPAAACGANIFLSTLSLRRATHCPARPTSAPVISIHALLAESDSYSQHVTRPSGISIHALLAESDFDRDQQNGYWPDFYPRSPCGERRNYGGDQS